MKKILFLLMSFLLTSCVTNYFYVNLEEDTPIYGKANVGREAMIIIPKDNCAYIASGSKKYRKVKWKNYKGWVVNPVYSIRSTSTYRNNSSSSSSGYNNSNRSSSGGTVHVKGYTRKDGTDVRPYTRSSPRRK